MGYAHRMAWWAAAGNRLCRHIARVPCAGGRGAVLCLSILSLCDAAPLTVVQTHNASKGVPLSRAFEPGALNGARLRDDASAGGAGTGGVCGVSLQRGDMP